MNNNVLFSTQIVSILIFIIALFVLYRLLVKQKDATIEFLQKVLDDAKQPMSDVLFKRQKDRLDEAYAELDRLSKDKATLQGANKRVQGYVDALIEAVSAQQEFIKLQKKFGDWVLREYSNEVKKSVDQPIEVIHSHAIDH